MPRAQFQTHFERARAAGLHSVPHAGETAGPQTVWDSLSLLQAERIGHGTSSAQDPALLRHLAETGIPLEVCPSSNVATRAVATLEEHPIRAFRDAGVIVTVNSDDPPMFGTSLNREYAIAADLLGLDEAGVADLARTAVRASFAPAEVQQSGARRDRFLWLRPYDFFWALIGPATSYAAGPHPFVTGVTARYWVLSDACRRGGIRTYCEGHQLASGRTVRVAIVNDYELVVVGVAALLEPFRDRVQVVEIDSNLPVLRDVDVILYDTFGQVQGRGRRRIPRDGGSAKVVIYSWNLHRLLVEDSSRPVRWATSRRGSRPRSWCSPSSGSMPARRSSPTGGGTANPRPESDGRARTTGSPLARRRSSP